ncbi:Bug family tripartite tricarboxylate transporter substrate binding protein [Dactylosporangium sucinum]|uniref:C4-dicarboxylate ABC transporter substrate-binding protein n=1 Tax=Dactylosporangium sucinum TaxID=1424081 RepID=A0A917T0Q9_9ACTN|nr:tripartite tricarboxylate transporter substrate binding protein [Dactylosporangium sucinum]GGM04803.1 C4-dicarboxylate ABC transporter substrate-binding protein [Dactylosporangium sucinum]
MGERRWLRVGAAVAVLTMGPAMSACGANTGGSAAAGGRPVDGLRILVPNSPASGYDTTARTAAKVMQDAGLARDVAVFNVAGAGGTVGLRRVVDEQGDENLLMQMGLGVVGAVYTNRSKVTLTDTVPVARLIEEVEAVVVPKESPYNTLQDLVAAWKADPWKVPVGGASAPGGPDHLLPMLLAKAVGVAPKRVKFVSYGGGGELLTAVLANEVAFAATGIGEVAEQAKVGEVKILAVTGAKRVAGVDAPTLEEQGVDLVFANWRGLVATPGLSAAQRQRLVDLVTRMHDSAEWKVALATRGWTDAFMTGDEFAAFLTSENERVAKVLQELGLG